MRSFFVRRVFVANTLELKLQLPFSLFRGFQLCSMGSELGFFFLGFTLSCLFSALLFLLFDFALLDLLLKRLKPSLSSFLFLGQLCFLVFLLTSV